MRIRGAAGLAKTLAERNPIAHGIQTAKEVYDNSHRLIKGKEPGYKKKLKRLTKM